MNIPKILHLSLIGFLLSTARSVDSSTATDSDDNQDDPPFWQFVLREFVFRTISSTVYNAALYKKLLEAPFYGGPLSEASNNENTLLSRGSVYRLPDDRWIFCQEDCEKCRFCVNQKTPVVRWSLKRVKRWTNEGLPKWNQRLTVSPRPLDKARRRRSKMKPVGESGSSWEFDYPDQEKQGRINDPTANRFVDGPNPRLIVGIDQHGRKHLVHVVPIYSGIENEESFGYDSSYRESYQPSNQPRISRMTQSESNKTSYDELIDRIFDSLGSHKNFIETFLFPERLQPKIGNDAILSSINSYPGLINEDERFKIPNDDVINYRDVSSHKPNGYPMESEHQVEENDQTYRRYPDTTMDVNKPKGVYQDQSSMIRYEPYGMSANDQEHDERSLPRADPQRRSRNSRGKLIHSSSTSGHQGFSEDHTRVNNNQPEISVRTRVNDNDRELANWQSDINQTDVVIQNFFIDSTTVDSPSEESINVP